VNVKAGASQFRIEPLGAKHNRAVFSCGIDALDQYLRTQAGQDVSKLAAAVFVITPDGGRIAGFYTLSAHAIHLGELPASAAKKLPRYPDVPVTLLGRLAVSTDYHGQGVGRLLLVDALRRVLANAREIASAAVVVDAKNDVVRNFYLRHGFVALPAQPNRLFYPVKTIEKLLGLAK